MSISSREKEILFDLQIRIQQGDIYAMEEWATFYAFNHPELLSDEIIVKVLEYYQKAIENNVHRAMLNMGALYYNGVIVKQNFAMAVKLYKMAIYSDEMDIASRALCNLGYCYYYGRSVPVDHSKAFTYFLKGALRFSDPNCLYKLGDMYRFGHFVEKDEEMAISLYKKALENIYMHEESKPDILKRLGTYYLSDCIEHDAILALKYLTEAQAFLYERIYVKKDPFSCDILSKIEELIERAKSELSQKR